MYKFRICEHAYVAFAGSSVDGIKGFHDVNFCKHYGMFYFIATNSVIYIRVIANKNKFLNHKIYELRFFSLPFCSTEVKLGRNRFSEKEI